MKMTENDRILVEDPDNIVYAVSNNPLFPDHDDCMTEQPLVLFFFSTFTNFSAKK